MNNFLDADRAYRRAIAAPGLELQAAFMAARSVPQIDLAGTDMTNAILLRMKAFSESQYKIKSHLDKRQASAAADLFVESVCFYLKIAAEKLHPSYRVVAEQPIKRRRSALRPDITVWHGQSLVAAIECKTQLGWNRDKWLADFESRERRLRSDFPNSEMFLLVLTGGNWPGFSDDDRAGKQFYVLLRDTWYAEFELALAPTLIEHTVEKLFAAILKTSSKLTAAKAYG